jgi:hypothetical protein
MVAYVLIIGIELSTQAQSLVHYRRQKGKRIIGHQGIEVALARLHHLPVGCRVIRSAVNSIVHHEHFILENIKNRI